MRSRCLDAHYQEAPKPISRLLPLYAADENDSESTTVVYSVFSKPASKIFQQLKKTESGLLRLEDFSPGWDELDEIIQDGDLSVQELQALYDAADTGVGEGLDLEGFKAFYKSIDELFDDDDDDDDDDDEEEEEVVPDDDAGPASDKSSPNADLVSYLEEVQQRECDSEDGTVKIGKRRPWGLDCTDNEREEILQLIDCLAKDESTNLLTGGTNNNGLPMSAKDLVKYLLGTWDLKYTNSRTMIINKSLSGLGRSTSELARNLGLSMKLSGNYYFGKAEFTETFGSGDDEDDDSDAVRLEAKVTGEWLLETGTRMNLKTGRPSVSLRIEVETIAYGPNKSGAEQWDSLSPIKLVDILYLDENLLVLRGNFNVDAIFVYTRV